MGGEKQKIISGQNESEILEEWAAKKAAMEKDESEKMSAITELMICHLVLIQFKDSLENESWFFTLFFHFFFHFLYIKKKKSLSVAVRRDRMWEIKQMAIIINYIKATIEYKYDLLNIIRSVFIIT